jgi:hypothetical protein
MTEKASRRNRTVYPFPTRRVLIPFEWKFSAEEFERVKVGVFPDDMGHWLIFLEGRRRQFLYFVRSWSGYTVYKLLVEKSQHEYRSPKPGSAGIHTNMQVLIPNTTRKFLPW